MIKLLTRNSTATLLQSWRWRYVSLQILTHHHHSHSLSMFQTTPQFLSPFSRYFSTKYYKDSSFVTSYLVNSCGLSPESALTVSTISNLKLKNSQRPDSVIMVLQSYGFSKTHIAEVVKKAPFVLLMDPQKTLLPKLEFFVSKGFSGSKLTKLIANYPFILRCRLSTFIVPNYEYIMGLLKSERRVVRAIQQHAPLISYGCNSAIDANVQILKDIGVSESHIALALERTPRLYVRNPAVFKELAERVKRKGFNPLKVQFVLAMTASVFTSESNWEKKLEVYKKWGWSEEVTLEACRRNVWCLMVSEEKITAVMDFLVNQMGLDSFFVSKYPWFLTRSLEKVLIPRLAVFKYLLSNGLIKEDAKLSVMLRCPEREYLGKFVNCYEQAPDILKIYEEKMSCSM